MNAPVYSAAARRSKKLPPLRVGVGGPVGSGKTTLLEGDARKIRPRRDHQRHLTLKRISAC
ncbi:MAG: Urease accessory protein UreG [uncultured Caballeronia sp.]|nr:MAG: Urease accessory protein UreG [uncultured Caballeronia sp.]